MRVSRYINGGLVSSQTSSPGALSGSASGSRLVRRRQQRSPAVSGTGSSLYGRLRRAAARRRYRGLYAVVDLHDERRGHQFHEHADSGPAGPILQAVAREPRASRRPSSAPRPPQCASPSATRGTSEPPASRSRTAIPPISPITGTTCGATIAAGASLHGQRRFQADGRWKPRRGPYREPQRRHGLVLDGRQRQRASSRCSRRSSSRVRRWAPRARRAR